MASSLFLLPHLPPFSCSRIPLLCVHVKASQISVDNLPIPSNASQSSSYVWVNPKSPKANQLRKQSYDARYSALVNLALSLDTGEATQQHVSQALLAFGDHLVEQDAVILLNNMKNTNNAVALLQHFQKKLPKLTKEVVLYNVTLKVMRKARDLSSAEKLFDEMRQRGVQPDNVTFSTMISCCRKCNLPHKAVEWFEKMPAFGCNPDDVTYSAMIDAYGRTGNVESRNGHGSKTLPRPCWTRL